VAGHFVAWLRCLLTALQGTLARTGGVQSGALLVGGEHR
jgi:hypothetical protein